MKASIIIVGSEMIKNRVEEKNSTILSQMLLKKGYRIDGKFFVEDDRKKIADILKYCMNRSELILITGGLGPTPDDLTIPSVASALRKKVVLSNRILNDLKKRFKNLPDDALKKHSLVIEGSKNFKNDVGLCYSQLIKFKGGKIFLLPGVVKEVLWLTENVLKKEIGSYRKTKEYNLKIFNSTEVEILKVLEDQFLKSDVSRIQFYPSYGFIDVFLEDKNIFEFLKKRFKENCLDTRGKSLNLFLRDLMLKKKLTLSIAESCTGGFLSKVITDVSKASKFFLGGVVTYSDRSKKGILGIEKMILEKFSSVSEIVSKKMAVNCSKIFCSNISLSITGYAGPDGGNSNTPVGTVFISIFYKNDVKTEKFIFTGDRETIRTKSVNLALFMILRSILNE